MLRRLGRIQLLYLLVMAIVVLMTPFLFGFGDTKHITVKYDNQVKEVTTNSKIPKFILMEAGIKLEPGDGWKFENGHKSLQDGCVLQVVRGVEFSVVFNGQTKKFKSSKETVGEALKDIGIKHPGEKIYPETHVILKPGMTIYVVNKDEHLHLHDVVGEIPVIYIDDKNMAAGTEKIEHHGKHSRIKIVSKISKNKQGDSITTELGKVVVDAGENKVVRRGTAQSVKTPQGFKRYSKKLICEATAYYEPGGYTASGTRTRYGAIATDPRYIPLGTKMYIPGYGLCVAEDTGGAIKGNIIDLYMLSVAQCYQWGRRNVEVYILEE